MGAWGGWALAPNIATGRDFRSHMLWSRQPRLTFNVAGKFLRVGSVPGETSVSQGAAAVSPAGCGPDVSPHEGRWIAKKASPSAANERRPAILAHQVVMILMRGACQGNSEVPGLPAQW